MCRQENQHNSAMESASAVSACLTVVDNICIVKTSRGTPVVRRICHTNIEG